MNKRVIAAISAGVLALLGVLVLVMWAQGANDRAFEGAKLVSVVRLTADAKVDTSAKDLAGLTETVELPDEAVPAGAVTDLDQVRGLSTNAGVQKGEVLLKSRMVEPGQKTASSNGTVPKGLQEVSIALDPERSLAGAVKAGDKVGVIVSSEKGTNLTLNQVLVTKVDTAIGAGDDGAVTSTMVTVAVRSIDAEKIVHGQRWATVWLTLQNPDTDDASAALVDLEDVLR